MNDIEINQMKSDIVATREDYETVKPARVITSIEFDTQDIEPMKITRVINYMDSKLDFDEDLGNMESNSANPDPVRNQAALVEEMDLSAVISNLKLEAEKSNLRQKSLEASLTKMSRDLGDARFEIKLLREKNVGYLYALSY